MQNGLRLYINWKSGKSSSNTIQLICHQSVRRTLSEQLRSTTYLKKLVFRLQKIEYIMPKLEFFQNSLQADNKSNLSSKRPKRFKSAIDKSLEMSSVFKIPLTTPKKKAPWKFNINCHDLTLSNFIKNTTPQNTFHCMILKIMVDYYIPMAPNPNSNCQLMPQWMKLQEV